MSDENELELEIADGVRVLTAARAVFAEKRDGISRLELEGGEVLEGEEVFHDLEEETVAVVRGGWGGAAEHGVEDGEVCAIGASP